MIAPIIIPDIKYLCSQGYAKSIGRVAKITAAAFRLSGASVCIPLPSTKDY